MDNKHLISIIIPVYNVELFLDQCIDSVLSQSISNFELILVDDGSPDKCPEMCDRWVQRDTRIKVVHKKNGGLSDARNEGLKIATGEYVYFLDSDDWIEKDYLETLYNVLLAKSCDVVSGSYKKVFERSIESNVDKDKRVCLLTRLEAMESLIDNSLIKQVVWNKLYTREVIADIHFEVGKYHEDEYWMYRVIGNANRIAYVDYDGYNYYQRPNSIMGEKFSKKRLDSIEAKIGRLSYIKDNFPDLFDKALIKLNFDCIYMGQQCLRDLSVKEFNLIIDYLHMVTKENSVSLRMIHNLKLSHQFWLCLSKVSFKLTCQIRNMFKVGL